MPVVKGERGARPTANPAPAPKPATPVVPPKSPGAIKTSIEPKPATVAAPSPGAIKTSAEPAAPQAPTGPPVPLLQKHGYNGSIQDFNGRVQSVHDEYQKAYGVAPSPGLTFDLARSPVDTAQFSKLFTVPLSQQAARSRAAINSQGLAAPEPVLDAKQLSSGIMEAAVHGDYHQFITEHADVIHDLSYQHKGDAATIAGRCSRRGGSRRSVTSRRRSTTARCRLAGRAVAGDGVRPGRVGVPCVEGCRWRDRVGDRPDRRLACSFARRRVRARQGGRP
jgi:hypothetical protein